MPPVQRVDEHAVCNEAAPGAQQGRRADPVRVAANDGVPGGEAEGQEHEREHDDQPQHTLFGEGADVGAVRRDRRDLLELARSDSERVLSGQLDARQLGAEPLYVIGLEAGAILEEAER